MNLVVQTKPIDQEKLPNQMKRKEAQDMKKE